MRTNEANPLRPRDWLVVLVAGALLGFAGVTKFHDPAPTAVFIHSLFYAESSRIVPWIAAFEISLALWLVSGVKARLAATLAACLFGAFAVTHVYVDVAVADAPACGCLGRVTATTDIPPAAWVATNILLALGCAAVAGGWRWKGAKRGSVTVNRPECAA